MRRVWILLPLLTFASATASAQVTVDLHALDPLPGGSSGSPSHSAPKRYPAPKRVTTGKRKAPAPEQATATPPATLPATPSETPPASASASANPAPGAPAAAPANLPTSEPPVATIAPVAPPPPEAASAPPPAAPISPTSTSAATASGQGLRVTFGTGQSDLSPSSAAAIQNLVKTTPGSDGTSYNVVAYAAGTPADPSTARRLSLSRALAVRSALMASGISSSHIYVRALGADAGDKTPDRVDVAVLGANASKGAQP
jgi:outer membrane protein OmpA-like peptidoglycan-associated protein